MQGNIHFFEGETKFIEIEVFPECREEVIVVNDSEYTVTNAHTGEEVQSGKCDFDGATASVLLTMNRRGPYLFTISVKIGLETIKAKTVIEVT